MDGTHESGYTFPLQEDDLLRGQMLKEKLDTGNLENAGIYFHDFVKHFLLRFPSSNNSSKWDSIIECLIAISALKEDGNFKAATDVTQIFAKLVYHIRGTILYEGIMQMGKYGNNCYQ